MISRTCSLLSSKELGGGTSSRNWSCDLFRLEESSCPLVEGVNRGMVSFTSPALFGRWVNACYSRSSLTRYGLKIERTTEKLKVQKRQGPTIRQVANALGGVRGMDHCR